MSECDSGALFVPAAGRLKPRRITAPDAWPDLRTVRRPAGLRLNGSVEDSESIPAQSAIAGASDSDEAVDPDVTGPAARPDGRVAITPSEDRRCPPLPSTPPGSPTRRNKPALWGVFG